jgi:hypothetical protein
MENNEPTPISPMIGPANHRGCGDQSCLPAGRKTLAGDEERRNSTFNSPPVPPVLIVDWYFCLITLLLNHLIWWHVPCKRKLMERRKDDPQGGTGGTGGREQKSIGHVTSLASRAAPAAQLGSSQAAPAKPLSRGKFTSVSRAMNWLFLAFRH